MWRSKKVIVGTVLGAVLLAGSIGGIALAADNGDEGQARPPLGALWDKVCSIYQEKTGVEIDQEALKDAFAEAKAEMRAEALENRLDRLVADGKMSQEQADEYLEWYEARPDVPAGLGFKGMRGSHRPAGLGGFGAPPAPAE